MFAPFGLFGRQPLHGVGILRRIAHGDLARFAHADRQRCALAFDSLADGVGERAARRVGDRGDIETVIVEDHRIDAGLRHDVEHRGARHGLAREIEIEVEIDMADPRFEWARKGLVVDCVGPVEHGRDRGCIGGRHT